MSLWLQRLGVELTGYALLPPTVPSLFEEGRVGEGMHSIIGDIRDLTALQDALKVAQPEIVIHMAAQPLVRYSYSNPVETYQTNVMGTVHLLEAVRQLAAQQKLLCARFLSLNGRQRILNRSDGIGFVELEFFHGSLRLFVYKLRFARCDRFLLQFGSELLSNIILGCGAAQGCFQDQRSLG